MLVKGDDHKEDIRLLLGQLDSRIQRNGVVHVGAHMGEEVDAYLDAGFKRIALIEANPTSCRTMAEVFRKLINVQIFNLAISDHDGIVNLYIHTSRTGSTEPASLLRLKKLKEIVKTISTPTSIEVECLTLDSFFEKYHLQSAEFDLLNLDIQGAELKALHGARKSLSFFKAVIVEVNLIELYEDAPLEKEICNLMEQQNFIKRYEIHHTLYDERGDFPAWGECLFIRKEFGS